MELKITKEQRNSAFSNMRTDFKNAKKSKDTIDKSISEWIDLYDGRQKQYSMTGGGSKYVSKEVARQIEFIKPNVSEPFVSLSHPIRIASSNRERTAFYGQKYLNGVFTGEFDRVNFIDNLTDKLLKEGTTWIKVGWNHIKKSKLERANDITIDEVASRGEIPFDAKKNSNGNIDVIYKHTKVVKNMPTAVVCRNENCYPDPSARNDDDLRFFIYEEEYTISDLRISGKYREEDLKSLEGKISEEKSSHSSLGNDKNSESEKFGRDTSFVSSDPSLQKVKVMEYYGEMDIDEDGIAEPIKGVWVDKYDVDLLLIENPMPSKRIPFYRAVYSADSDVLWGKALAFFVGDNQKAKTGMVRAMFDNMSIANNGQKFVDKKMLDYVNMQRMRKGERVVFTNKDPNAGMKDGSFNQLPSSFFNIFQVVSSEADDISGINKNSMDSVGKSKDDQDFQLTLAQQRMADCVRNVGNLMSKIFREWLELAAVYMTDEDIARLYPSNSEIDYTLFDELDDMNISMKVATDAQRSGAIKQLNMLLQQSKSLGDKTPPETIPNITAEMFEQFDRYDEAERLRNYKPQPSPQQIQMQQMELMEKQLILSKLQKEIEEIDSRKFLNMAGGQSKMIDSQAGAKYKETQSIEKMAKAEAHGVNSALAPVDVLNNLLNKNNGGNR